LKSQNKHSVEITKLFKRRIRSLITEYRMVLLERVEELSSNAYIGKPLKGPYKGRRAVRVGRRYRLIYEIPEFCVVRLLDLRHGESAY